MGLELVSKIFLRLTLKSVLLVLYAMPEIALQFLSHVQTEIWGSISPGEGAIPIFISSSVLCKFHEWPGRQVGVCTPSPKFSVVSLIHRVACDCCVCTATSMEQRSVGFYGHTYHRYKNSINAMWALRNISTGWLKKVSCCTVSTAYFFEPPCIYESRNQTSILGCFFSHPFPLFLSSFLLFPFAA